MKRATIFSLFALGLSSAVATTGQTNAQGEGGLIKVVESGIAHSAFFGLSMDATRSVAVGIGGAIYQSEDGGQTWEAVAHEATELALLAVDRGGDHTIAVGQMGLVMYEESPGKWAKADAGFDGRILSVSVNAAGLAFAGGEFGTVLKSEDGGRSWTPSAPPWTDFEDKETFGTAEPHVYAVHVAENGEVTLAGEYGVILRSADRGQTWKVLKELKARTPTISALHIAEPGTGNSYAVGQEGEILTSSDGGTTWLRCSTNTTANFLGVASKPNGEVVATGFRIMMRSTNGGITWYPVEEADILTDWYQTAKTDPTSGRIIAVGHSGRIIQIGS
ncbi:YCF48-related protein [Panacagrimonas sp.]|uniref:YCF48-related protein n=1 Tax=Panacagrimonas sp. TaxID=2480088 RepID=UPI003B528935